MEVGEGSHADGRTDGDEAEVGGEHLALEVAELVPRQVPCFREHQHRVKLRINLRINWRLGREREKERRKERKKSPHLNMMMPPTKVTQRAAPKEVAKQRRCASLAAVARGESGERGPAEEATRESGAKTTPTARKATAAMNLVAQPMAKRVADLGFVWSSWGRSRLKRRGRGREGIGYE